MYLGAANSWVLSATNAWFYSNSLFVTLELWPTFLSVHPVYAMYVKVFCHSNGTIITFTFYLCVPDQFHTSIAQRRRCTTQTKRCRHTWVWRCRGQQRLVSQCVGLAAIYLLWDSNWLCHLTLYKIRDRVMVLLWYYGSLTFQLLSFWH